MENLTFLKAFRVIFKATGQGPPRSAQSESGDKGDEPPNTGGKITEVVKQLHGGRSPGWMRLDSGL